VGCPTAPSCHAGDPSIRASDALAQGAMEDDGDSDSGSGPGCRRLRHREPPFHPVGGSFRARLSVDPAPDADGVSGPESETVDGPHHRRVETKRTQRPSPAKATKPSQRRVGVTEAPGDPTACQRAPSSEETEGRARCPPPRCPPVVMGIGGPAPPPAPFTLARAVSWEDHRQSGPPDADLEIGAPRTAHFDAVKSKACLRPPAPVVENRAGHQVQGQSEPS
jgi:hypothetical protein